MNWNEKTVLVTVSKGFLGSFLVKELEKLCPKKIITPSSKELDLRDNSNCKKAVLDVDIVFHLAAHVGGIGLNKDRPGDLFYDNLMMGTQLLHEAKNASVQKFIALGTVCSYPKFSQIPFLESSIWDGYPEETNAPYGLAKKMMLVQSQAYREQYNFKSIVVIPTNLYGPNDNFDPLSSHVIPALILKIDNAKKNNSKSITLWGDGTPTRDFLYVEEASRGIILAADKYDDPLPINLSSEEEISIKQLAELISDIMKFDGKITWDTSKPNGQPRRCVSNKKAREKLNFKPEISLTEGLRRTIEWYNAQ